jgi:hypothetical protein
VVCVPAERPLALHRRRLDTEQRPAHLVRVRVRVRVRVGVRVRVRVGVRVRVRVRVRARAKVKVRTRVRVGVRVRVSSPRPRRGRPPSCGLRGPPGSMRVSRAPSSKLVAVRQGCSSYN